MSTAALDTEEEQLVAELERLSGNVGFLRDGLRALRPVQASAITVTVGAMRGQLAALPSARAAHDDIERLVQLQERVGDTVEFARALKAIQTCVKDVQGLVAADRFEDAAQYLSQFRGYVRNLEEEAAAAVARAMKIFMDRCVAGLDAALAECVHDENAGLVPAARWLRLLTRVGEESVGVMRVADALCKALRESCAEREQQLHKQFDGQPLVVSSAMHVHLLTHLFEAAARVIVDADDLAAAPHSVNVLVTLAIIRRIDEQCESIASRSIDAFGSQTRLTALQKAVEKSMVSFSSWSASAASGSSAQGAAAASGAGSASSGADGPPDPRDVDAVLDAAMGILHRVSRYGRYVRDTCQQCVQRLDAATRATLPASVLPRELPVERAAGDVLRFLTSGERYFMYRSVDRALSIDRVPAPLEPACVTSSVEDAFFVVSKSVRRVLATQNHSVVCACLNNAAGVLGDVFLPAQSKQLSDASPVRAFQVAKELGFGGGLCSDKYVCLLNNLDACRESILKLCAEVDTTLSGVLSASEYQLVDLSLRMLQELADRSSALLSDGCDAVAQKLMHKLRFGLDRFDATSYVMGEDDFDAFSAHDPFAVDTAEALRSCLVPFAEYLSPGSLGALVQVLAAMVAERLEQMALSKKYSMYGGLQLEKDVQAISVAFASLTHLTVRDRFARLSQVASVLTVHDLAEMVDFYQQRNITWRLSPAEVRRVLMLRTDLDAQAVQRAALVQNATQ